MKICKVDYCKEEVGKKGAKGLCPKHYKRLKRNGSPFKKKIGVEQSCKDCGKCFIKKAWNHNRCYKCIERHYYQKSKDRYEQRKLNPEHKKICVLCKKSFNAIFNRTKYCGRKCYFEDQKKKRIGKGNPAYRNGEFTEKFDRNKYYWRSKEFIKNAKIIRENMIKESGYYYCQHCKVNQSARWETHHIIFRSEKPRHPHLHHLKNLIRVCINCHNLFHKYKNKMRDKYIKERELEDLFETNFTTQ